MALATKLLQGVNTEWALVKRHSSEDLFGVQVAGAFPDSMARCAQLLSETCDIDFIDINVGCPIDMIFDMVCRTHACAITINIKFRCKFIPCKILLLRLDSSLYSF